MLLNLTMTQKNDSSHIWDLIEDGSYSVVKGSPDPSHFIFEINPGKRRIRHRTTLNLNDLIFSRFELDLKIQYQSRSMSDPPLSDIGPIPR